MILKQILASFTFRFLAVYIVALSVGVFLLLGSVYAWLSKGYLDEVHHAVELELEQLQVAWNSGGVDSFNSFVQQRNGPKRLSRFFYIAVDASGNKLAGTLDEMPPVKSYRDQWLGFTLEAITGEPEDNNHVFIARSTELADGTVLLAARQYADVIYTAALVGGALIRSMIVTILMGLVGGVVIAALGVRRINVINQQLGQIMTGNLSARVDTDKQFGDYGLLTDNLNNMLDQIEKLMAGVRQVSDNIAHDLRTPLTRLRNNLSALQEDNDIESRNEKVNGLIEEADALLATFNSLLRIAQIETGNRRTEFEKIELHQMLEDVVEMYEPLAAEQDIAVTVKLQNVSPICGDRNLLFQCFANLVDNAIKYTPSGGKIEVRLAQHCNNFQIDIADSGPGVPAEERENVFQRFYRMDSARSEHSGNGLGLALVAAVVKQHGGEISLRDNRPGLRVVVNLRSGVEAAQEAAKERRVAATSPVAQPG